MNAFARFTKHPSAILLVVQLLSVMAYPFMEDTAVGRAAFGVLGVVVLGVAVWAVRSTPALTWVAGLLGVPVLVLTILEGVWPHNSDIHLVSGILHAAFYAYTAYALKCVLDPLTPNNSGSLRPISVTAPEGTIVNATRPAPVWARHLTGHYLPFVVFGALAKVLPDRIIADSGAPGWSVYFKGVDPASRRRFVRMYFMTGGYGAVDILHSCTLAVEPGEIAVIVGPNGAGKSTAMKAVFGMLKLRQGSVKLNGEDITGLTPQARVRKGMGFVPQGRCNFPLMTVRENLELGAYTLASSATRGALERVLEDRYQEPAQATDPALVTGAEALGESHPARAVRELRQHGDGDDQGGADLVQGSRDRAQQPLGVGERVGGADADHDGTESQAVVQPGEEGVDAQVVSEDRDERHEREVEEVHDHGDGEDADERLAAPDDAESLNGV